MVYAIRIKPVKTWQIVVKNDLSPTGLTVLDECDDGELLDCFAKYSKSPVIGTVSNLAEGTCIPIYETQIPIGTRIKTR